MNVLIIGSGGREHALAWKISQSPQVKKLFCAPGNAGTDSIAENADIKDTDIDKLIDFANKKKIDLTVVGPELPLTYGIVDAFEKKGMKIFGPDKRASKLEGSKVFAKQFMERHRIPTAHFDIADSVEKAQKILRSGDISFPLVIKADGLAAGKGVIICSDKKKADEALNDIMIEKKFGESGDRVVIEECLQGKEVSFIVFSDGTKIAPLVTTMDHKPVFDGNEGPNTGGMGAISPSPFIDRNLFSEIVHTIVFPTVLRMLEEGRKYKGILYVGLMLTDEGPKVLEYNCRFGDPETQPQMLRMNSDLIDVLLAVIEEDILNIEIKWSKKPSACVVLTSKGYPLEYEKGKEIQGIEELSSSEGITVFHSGTKYEQKKYFTNGGRVLGVCASEGTLAETMDKIYTSISIVHFDGMHYRKDIGVY
ncbi:MAG: phosphoribosylamine--glycine ligase [Candidatus Aminicenantaceae bacterium]